MLDLGAIEKRWVAWRDYEESSAIEAMLGEDIPALVAEVKRLTQRDTRTQQLLFEADYREMQARSEIDRLRAAYNSTLLILKAVEWIEPYEGSDQQICPYCWGIEHDAGCKLKQAILGRDI